MNSLILITKNRTYSSTRQQTHNYQRHSNYRTTDSEKGHTIDMERREATLKVPNGFRNLLESVTLEILQVQPTNITQCAADYLRGRLKAREEKGYDECLLGSQIDGHYRYEPSSPEKTNQARSNTIPSNQRHGVPINYISDVLSNEHQDVPSNELSKVPSNDNPQNRVIQYDDKDLAASKIQAGFHGYKCRQQIKEQHQAAGKIQAGYRGYACRQDLKNKHEAATKIQVEYKSYQIRKTAGKNITSEENDREVEPSRSIEHQNKHVPSFSSKDEAAIAIQAGYRGYKDRKYISKRSEAATTIQGGYRGYRVRKHRRDQSDAALIIQKKYREYRARKVRHVQSQAALKIQTSYRRYRVRKGLNSDENRPSIAERKEVLDVLQQDSRSSFSFPIDDVKFEGDLDSDSDIDIDKVVDQMEAQQKINPQDNQDNEV